MDRPQPDFGLSCEEPLSPGNNLKCNTRSSHCFSPLVKAAKVWPTTATSSLFMTFIFRHLTLIFKVFFKLEIF